MKNLILISALFVMAFFSCSKEIVKDIPSNWGKVTYIEKIDAYGIVMDDGRKLFPLNLDIKFQVDTLPVLFDYVPVEEKQLIEWGSPIKITRMQME